MASYPIGVRPPQSSIPDNELVPEDELRLHPEKYFQGSDLVWVTVAACLVLQMIPAVSMFYSGATDRSSTLTLLRMPIITAAFCTVQWYLWGYVLTFSPAPDPTTWTWYGGHIESVVLYRALVRPVGAAGPKIPELLFAFYQGMFAAFTPALICGGVIKKFKVGRFLIFIWLWSLLVYYPVARWTWGSGGFSEQNGVMDFAGGTAVHITSGTAVGAVVLFQALERHRLRIFRDAWDIIWSARKPEEEEDAVTLREREAHPPPEPLRIQNYGPDGLVEPQPRVEIPNPAVHPRRVPSIAPPAVRDEKNAAPLAGDAPHSLNNLVLGTMMLWIGWLGFNGGSALGGNMRSVAACVATHVAASSGACVMLLLFWILKWCSRSERGKKYFRGSDGGAKVSVVHFCDGAVVGLVAITPAAGFVPAWGAGAIGAIASVSIYALKSTVLQRLMRQDPLWVFLLHTGGGFIGMFLTGCFARQYIVGLDGYSSIPDRSVAERLRWQVTDAFMGFGFTLGMTLAILAVMKILLRPLTGEWRLLADDETDKLEAELEYTWKRRTE